MTKLLRKKKGNLRGQNLEFLILHNFEKKKVFFFKALKWNLLKISF